MFGRISILARVTFLEALRQRFFHLVFWVSLALVVSTLFFKQFNFGSSELKFILDLGSGTVVFFGTVVAIVLSGQAFFSEIEHRTVMTILARPVPRYAFLLGKYLGILALLFCFVTVIYLVLTGLLYQRHQALLVTIPEPFAEGDILRYGDLPLLGLVQWIELGIIAGMTFCVAAISRSTLYTVVVSFLLVVIAQLQYLAESSYEQSSHILVKGFSGLIRTLVPNFQVFNLGDLLVYSESGSYAELSLVPVIGYGLFYLGAAVVLAVLLFQMREL